MRFASRSSHSYNTFHMNETRDFSDKVVKKCYIPINKVLEKPWRYFTFLKLCKCSQFSHSATRVASTSDRNALNYATFLAIRLRESS